MPKTKFQSVIFTAMMVFCMVFSMTCYTIALQLGGLSYQVFALAIREMWVEYVIVFLLVFFLVTPAARALGARVMPAPAQPILSILTTQCLTVAMVVPTITLIATFLHHGLTGQWLVQWLQTWVLCFPMALCLQLFYAGPLVRRVFRLIF